MDSSNAAKPRILVVDDDAAARNMLVRVLNLRGFTVDGAESGARALELARQHAYPVAVLDYKMPNMNGVELFEKLRQLRPEIEAIFLTGYPTVDTVYPAIVSGVQRVLAKPVDMDELIDVIHGLHPAAN
jgi:CheY-like chemotaxis protein